jgi:hypothetical protein
MIWTALYPNTIIQSWTNAQSRIRKVLHSRSHDVVIRVYDSAGDVIETHEHKGDSKEW